MSLEEYQERVKRHFESLARFREGSGFQVFAIEHGLGENEIEEMLSLLRQSLRSRPSLSSHLASVGDLRNGAGLFLRGGRVLAIF